MNNFKALVNEEEEQGMIKKLLWFLNICDVAEKASDSRNGSSSARGTLALDPEKCLTSKPSTKRTEIVHCSSDQPTKDSRSSPAFVGPKSLSSSVDLLPRPPKFSSSRISQLSDCSDKGPNITQRNNMVKWWGPPEGNPDSTKSQTSRDAVSGRSGISSASGLALGLTSSSTERYCA
ncbi:hypothetical protein D9758_002527 [Tetrapyrgos nigripes]|uniref:Uncharacterized protein n=1 Tax=Tetrapyrgos nigripes TaxID=182062 RepID=A0A8H5GQJ1_9AGAR|nr:hypothetical protein D9758_002527 [Tetrapyrgos nigripes]